jgi:hypothetical protein
MFPCQAGGHEQRRPLYTWWNGTPARRATGPRRRPPLQACRRCLWLAPGPAGRPGCAIAWPACGRAGLAAVLPPGLARLCPWLDLWYAAGPSLCWPAVLTAGLVGCAVRARPLAPLCGPAAHAPGNLPGSPERPVARWMGECLTVRSQALTDTHGDACACTRPGAAGRRCAPLWAPLASGRPLRALLGPLQARPGACRGRPAWRGGAWPYYAAPGAAVRSGCAAGPGDGRCCPGRRRREQRYTAAHAALYILHARLSGRRGDCAGPAGSPGKDASFPCIRCQR